MKGDTLIFIAFCAFIVLLGIRMIQQFEKKKRIAVEKEEDKASEPCPVSTKRRRYTCFWAIVQVVVLAGLIIYMIPVLIEDFSTGESREISSVFLRCLIFVFTIYIFIRQWRRVFGKENKEKTSE